MTLREHCRTQWKCVSKCSYNDRIACTVSPVLGVTKKEIEIRFCGLNNVSLVSGLYWDKIAIDLFSFILLWSLLLSLNNTGSISAITFYMNNIWLQHCRKVHIFINMSSFHIQHCWYVWLMYQNPLNPLPVDLDVFISLVQDKSKHWDLLRKDIWAYKKDLIFIECVDDCIRWYQISLPFCQCLLSLASACSVSSVINVWCWYWTNEWVCHDVLCDIRIGHTSSYKT